MGKKDITIVDEHDLSNVGSIPTFDELLQAYHTWNIENGIDKPFSLTYDNVGSIIKQMVDPAIQDNCISEKSLMAILIASIVLGINKQYPLTDPQKFDVASKSTDDLKREFGTGRIKIVLKDVRDSIQLKEEPVTKVEEPVVTEPVVEVEKEEPSKEENPMKEEEPEVFETTPVADVSSKQHKCKCVCKRALKPLCVVVWSGVCFGAGALTHKLLCGD